MIVLSFATTILALGSGSLWSDPEDDPGLQEEYCGSPELVVSAQLRSGYYRDSRLTLHIGDGPVATSERFLDGWIAGAEVLVFLEGRLERAGLGIGYDHAEVSGQVAGHSIRGHEDFLTLALHSGRAVLEKEIWLYYGLGAGVKFAELESQGRSERDFDLSLYVPVGLAVRLDRVAFHLDAGIIGEFDLFARAGISLDF